MQSRTMVALLTAVDGLRPACPPLSDVRKLALSTLCVGGSERRLRISDGICPEFQQCYRRWYGTSPIYPHLRISYPLTNDNRRCLSKGRHGVCAQLQTRELYLCSQ